MVVMRNSSAESDQLANARIAILGMGLMGGSLAQALRGHCAALLGVDPDAHTLSMAQRMQIVDQLSTDPAEILPLADMVILAAPVSAILRLLHDLPDLHPGPAVVLDLGSTKASIVGAMETLPPRFDPIGGHPMCGKEVTTLANAEPDLFRGSTFAFTPLARSTDQARSLAGQLAHAVGAHPIWLEAEEHDRWAASTSHLPYLVAAALAAATPAEVTPLIGPGFRSTTRLAGTSPELMLDILMTNRNYLLAATGRFEGQLRLVRDCLESEDWPALLELLTQGVDRRDELSAGGDAGGKSWT
jgi:prephenate dehydrogenase